MDFLTQLQFLTVPKWLRNLVIIVTTALILLCFYMFYAALSPENTDVSWMEAGAYLTGIVFPITLAIILIAGVQTGVHSIQNKTDRFLTETLPSILKNIPEQNAKFQTYTYGQDFRSNAISHEAEIRVSHTKTHCYADYHILFDHADGYKLDLPIRAEINVKRVNLCIYTDPEKLAKLMKKKPSSTNFQRDVTQFLYDSFKSTIFGAQVKTAIREKNKDANQAKQDVEEGYQFNATPFYRKVGDKNYLTIVAHTRISEDMLWHSAETLYFSQDLMFMLRAIAYEAPEIFKAEAS